ncbi:uncharacterized protein [Paramisgurnus dabryanus]|uniref:uncharacterized protein n=1 Tax=Paramisgurnus dabryanus TaxID=90735 RepID=UPI003CCF7C5E
MKKMDFISALRERGVPEENLTKMEEDKIDPNVAKLLNDKELSKYIPRYGDRVFAQNWLEFNREENGNEERKQKLINPLREKMNLPAISNQKKKYGHGNKNAETKTRKIELGWMHYQNCSYKQVNQQKGMLMI